MWPLCQEGKNFDKMPKNHSVTYFTEYCKNFILKTLHIKLITLAQFKLSYFEKWVYVFQEKMQGSLTRCWCLRETLYWIVVLFTISFLTKVFQLCTSRAFSLLKTWEMIAGQIITMCKHWINLISSDHNRGGFWKHKRQACRITYWNTCLTSIFKHKSSIILNLWLDKLFRLVLIIWMCGFWDQGGQLNEFHTSIQLEE